MKEVTQRRSSVRRVDHAPAFLAGGLLLLGAHADVVAQPTRISAGLSVTETLTDNVELTQNGKRGELITQVSPSLNVAVRHGPMQGSLSYALNGLLYARGSSSSSVYHSLASSGQLTLLDGKAGVSASASAGRQVVSPFGAQSDDPALNVANRTQVFSYSLAPFLSGQLLGEATYRISLAYSQSTTGSSASSDAGSSRSLTGALALNGRVGQLGWGLNGSRLATESAASERSYNSRLSASLSFSPDVEWGVSLRGGVESDSIRTTSSQQTVTFGAGASWRPTPRTSVRIDMDRRFFGRSYSTSVSHRMARTVWTFVDSRSLDTSGSAGVSSLTNFEFYSQLFASITDPAVRDAVVRDFLASRNLDPNGREASGGFLTTGPTVQRRQNLSMAYRGLRATFTVSAFQTRSDSASQVNTGSTIQQRGFSASLSHRLTPSSSLVVTASRQQTPGAGSQSGNDLSSIVATWSAKLGRASNVSLGLRHSQFDSDTNPYQESALIGTVRMQF